MWIKSSGLKTSLVVGILGTLLFNSLGKAQTVEDLRVVDHKLEDQAQDMLRDDPSYGVILGLCQNARTTKEFESRFIFYVSTVFDSMTDVFSVPLEPTKMVRIYGQKGLSDTAYGILKSDSFALALNDCAQQKSHSDHIKAKVIGADYGGKAVAFSVIALFFATKGPAKIHAHYKKLMASYPKSCGVALTALAVGGIYTALPEAYAVARLAFSSSARNSQRNAINSEVEQRRRDDQDPLQQDLEDCQRDLEARRKALSDYPPDSKEYAQTQLKIKNDEIAILLFKKALNSKS